eukprot:1756704-Amphidinium_carterae.1
MEQAVARALDNAEFFHGIGFKGLLGREEYPNIERSMNTSSRRLCLRQAGLASVLCYSSTK